MPFSDPKKHFEALREKFELLRLRDQRRLRGELLRVRSALNGDPCLAENQLSHLALRIGEALPRSLVKKADALRYSYPEDLPISSHAEQIRKKILENQVVIICGSTGSGKTTQLPKIALSAGLGRKGCIGCTQPRRIAASSLAARVANELDCRYGEEVGCKVRFDDSTSASTVIKFMTDGILLAETRSDPLLLQYDCIILDEVHERSLNVDFLLGYLKLLLEKRPDLKLLISSATLESDRISRFFGNCPVEEVEGRLFPIEDIYLPPEEEEELTETITRGIEFLNELDPRGDILVFLPGEREIRDCAEMLAGRDLRGTSILPLFGRLSAEDQKRVFLPSRSRRIVLATNVAETSLTIPGIRYVVDSGLVRLSRYNPRTRIQELRVEFISQASARQRRGRCGRLRDGVCVHLYSEEQLKESAEFTPPEIQRSSLAGVILQMASLNLPPLGTFPLIDEPSSVLIREGMRTLNDIRALDGTRLTPSGRRLAMMPIDPQLGKMLLEAHEKKILPEMLVIAAFLSIPDPRERPFEKANEADAAHRKFLSEKSDFIGILNLWLALKAEPSNQALRKFAKKNYLNFRRIREWRNLTEDLRNVCEESGCSDSREIDLEKLMYDTIHKVILSGLPRQLGIFDEENHRYSDMAGKKYLIFPGSGLAKQKKTPGCILSFALVETSQVFARCCAAADPQWLESVAPHLCSHVYDNPAWDEQSGFVYARERVIAGQLLIHPGRRCHYAKTHPVEARQIFLREGVASGKASLRGTWLEKTSQLIRKIHLLELKIRRPDTLIDENALFEYFDSVLPSSIVSVDAVKKDWNANHHDYTPELGVFTTESLEEIRESDYPAFLTFSGQRFPLIYRYDPGEENDGITLEVREDQLNLLEPHLLDYLVPGYLPLKIESLLRALPKRIRIEFTPVQNAAESFMEAYRNGEIITEQPLAEALAEFIFHRYGVQPDRAYFENAELPEFLQMKLAVLNARGKIKEIRRDFPPLHRVDSRLSRNIPTVRKWDVTGSMKWPGNEELPETIHVSKDSGTLGYPALTAEENSVGIKVFLRENEAKRIHEAGLVRLCRLELPQMIRHMNSSLKVPGDLELSFFLNYPEWRDDMTDNALKLAFPCPGWQIRSESSFADALEAIRDHAADILLRNLENLHSVFAVYQSIVSLIDRMDEESECAAALDQRLQYLFRRGFLRFTSAFSRYPRYLKALKIRAERALTAPGKDFQKGEDLEPYLSKIELALKEIGDPENSGSFAEFLLIFEEANINRYAPELGTLEKCGPEALRTAWEKVRL